jgi:hypothetical protein
MSVKQYKLNIPTSSIIIPERVNAKTKLSFETLQRFEADYLQKGIFPTTPCKTPDDSWFSQWVRSMGRMRSSERGIMRNADFKLAWDELVDRYNNLFDEEDDRERGLFAKITEGLE